MKFLRLLPVAATLMTSTAWAVYAPIPEQEQGKEFSVTATVGISHDSNIFGAATNAIGSTVYSFSPEVKFNSSVTDQTFLSASYKLMLDHFTDRPGDKTIDSHQFEARLAHAFSKTTNVDVSDAYAIMRNPESLLAGVPVNTDQSFKSNQADARFTTNLGQKTSGTLKARAVNYAYDNAVLANSLDHSEYLYAGEVGYDFLPETKLVGEYRHQVIAYDTGGATKDKRSDFLIGGFDYNVARKLLATVRGGYEWRRRDGAPDAGAPYAELSLKYDYAEKSYLSAGYVYTFEETSNLATYLDTKVNRLFVNVQHAFTALIVASASVTYEPSQLQGRGTAPDIDETTVRVGAALSYLVNKNWTLSATYDHDKVDSDDPSRGMTRDRLGVSAAFSF